MIPKALIKIWLFMTLVLLAAFGLILGWAFVGAWCSEHPLNFIWFGPISFFGVTGGFAYLCWRLES